MNRMYFLLLILCSAMCFDAQGQRKLEQEYRMKKASVPKQALKDIQSLAFDKKIKWYREEGLHSSSIEAKVKQGGYRYSVEFDTLGQLEDLEVTVDFDELPKEVQQSIEQSLDTTFASYRIVKTQIQHMLSWSELKTVVSNPTFAPRTAQFELVIKARRNERYHSYECLFSYTGEILRHDILIFRNTDNLEY